MKRIFRARDYEPDADRDLAEELQAHLELMVEDLMVRGMSEDAAREEAKRALGAGREAHTTAAPQARASLRRRTLRDRFETLIQDVRYAVRRMVRSPGFTAIAILSLAIGIGANTAVFSVVNAFLIRKAPFRAPEELVRIYTNIPRMNPYATTAYPEFLALREMPEVFTAAGASELLLTAARVGDEPRRVMVEAVSAGLFPMLGVEPVLGRNFLPREDVTPGEHPVAILGYGFWQRVFGGDPGVLGRTLTLAGRSFTIVGVAPERFNSTTVPVLKMDLFIPVTMSAATSGMGPGIYQSRDQTRFQITARLAPGVSIGEARSRLEVLASQLQEAYPATNQDRSFRILPNSSVTFDPDLDGGMQITAAFLLAVVGLVLLLACTNLASFLLARGVERQKEVAMRLALGAGRARLVRQLLTETLLLGLAGGMAGLAVARATLDVVTAFQPPIPVSLSLDLTLDGRVFLFTLGISVFAGMLFGLAPALQSTKPEVAPTLKGGGSRPPGRRLPLQTGLVALQMTVSMILLVGSGLFLRSLLSALDTDPGFSTEEAGIAWIDLSSNLVPREEWDGVRLDLEERLRAQPGVQTVTSAGRLPLSLRNSFQTFTIPGVDPPTGQDGHRISLARVSPGYFQAMGIPILAGRAFGLDDRPASPRVVVVSQHMADTFWPGENPIGKTLSSFEGGPMTVVGVAGDTKVNTLGEPLTPFLYFSSAQTPSDNIQLLIRGPLPPAELVATLRRVIKEADPNLVVMEVKTMKDHLAVLLFGPRAAALLLGIFGALALFLSSIGLYGVVSFSVSRRTREVGIRMSLGADRTRVVRMVVGRAMGVVLMGAVAGLGIAFVLARLVQVFLLGVSPADPVTMVAGPFLLLGVALLAALIPALRASRVNPVEALRTE